MGGALVFWAFALMAIAGAVAMITRRNAISAVMCLVGTIVAMAGLYAMLYAHFLAIIQVLVYAGAIMVLFVFVIMILNQEEEEPWARGLVGKIVAGGALGYLVVRLAAVLWGLRTADLPAIAPRGELETFGTTAEVGRTMFTDFLFPFEAVALLLLIAVVGALVLGRPHEAAAPHE
jgi:NADH-quinone oxidoreductase subunit J